MRCASTYDKRPSNHDALTNGWVGATNLPLPEVSRRDAASSAEPSKPHSMVINRLGRRFASEAAYFDLCDAWNHVDPRLRTA